MAVDEFFDRKLDEELYKKRREIAIRKILEAEYSQRDLSKVYGNSITTKPSMPAIKLPNTLIAGGVSALLAPILLSALGHGKVSTALKVLSMPIAGLGGATIYSLLKHTSSPQFTQAYPVRQD